MTSFSSPCPFNCQWKSAFLSSLGGSVLLEAPQCMHLLPLQVDFFFFAYKKYSRKLCKITVEPLMPHGLFYRCPCYVSGPGNIVVALLSMEGQRALPIHQKYLHVCSEDERRSYRFGTTWGWVINDRIFIFEWTNTLIIRIINVSWAANQHIRMISEGSCDTEDWSNDAENSQE